jgi:hypothetical protein
MVFTGKVMVFTASTLAPSTNMRDDMEKPLFVSSKKIYLKEKCFVLKDP